MSAVRADLIEPSAAEMRLSALAPLDMIDIARLAAASCDGMVTRARRELRTEGRAITGGSILLAGWACRMRILGNGDRQIIGVVLPGELIDVSVRQNSVAIATTTAVTDIVTCPAPRAIAGSGLAEAYAVSAALEEAYLCRQIARLGRMSAQERLVDWLLETYDRLAMSSNVSAGGFAMPMTQELIGDALGLTSVHVNRTVRTLRDERLATIGGRTATIHDRRRMTQMVNYEPVKVIQAS